jgi:zinc transporter, ZIP family
VDVLLVFLAGSATALATGLGAVPVSMLGRRTEQLRPALWGVTVGLMSVASVVGLLEPAFDHGSAAAVLAGVVAGVAFLVVASRVIGARDVHVGELRGAGVRTVVVVFVVLFVHSLPEGFAVGTAYASKTAGLSLFVILAIGLQNVPEGTSVAIPMDAAGFRPAQQFWAAVATSAPQPVGAVVSYLLVEHIRRLLPLSFGFAAGAMLAIVAAELAPRAFAAGARRQGAAGSAAGAAVMLALAATLGV